MAPRGPPAAAGLLSAGGAGSTYRFHQTAPLPREGYPGVVDAESGLARDLARAIASAIQAQPQG